MQALAVHPFAAAGRAAPDLETDHRRARWLANWLDTKFELFGVRFGLEGIVGLVPVVGDTLGLLAGLYPVYLAKRHNLGRRVRVQMGLNLLIEWLIGITPIVGDAADVWFKANIRNLKLLERAAASKR
jgi:hypothetical protein